MLSLQAIFNRSPNRRSSPFIAWLAMCLLLLQIITPAFAQARSASPLVVQICSAHGAKTIYLDIKGDTNKKVAQKNCNCCLVGAVAPPLALSWAKFDLPAQVQTSSSTIAFVLLPQDANFLWHSRLKQAPPHAV